MELNHNNMRVLHTIDGINFKYSEKHFYATTKEKKRKNYRDSIIMS